MTNDDIFSGAPEGGIWVPWPEWQSRRPPAPRDCTEVQSAVCSLARRGSHFSAPKWQPAAQIKAPPMGDGRGVGSGYLMVPLRVSTDADTIPQADRT